MKHPKRNRPTGAGTPSLDGDESSWINPRTAQIARRAANARKGSGRRRLIDPATCERDYTQAEMEFMQAMQAYKTTSGRMFPTWGEVLQVVHHLGYQKFGPEDSTGEASKKVR